MRKKNEKTRGWERERERGGDKVQKRADGGMGMG